MVHSIAHVSHKERLGQRSLSGRDDVWWKERDFDQLLSAGTWVVFNIQKGSWGQRKGEV